MKIRALSPSTLCCLVGCCLFGPSAAAASSPQGDVRISKGSRFSNLVIQGVRVASGKGRVVALPGFLGERIDRRLLRDIAYLQSWYNIWITDGYAREGHSALGEHPMGLAIDVIPGPGGSWKQIDRLAKWAEPRQNQPRVPFRWVGYSGDKNHGNPKTCKRNRGGSPHLHLSWNHSPERPGKIASWVNVFAFAAR